MKYISSTYLKDVTDYTFELFCDKTKDYYITVKKINKIKAPFILNEEGRKVVIVDNAKEEIKSEASIIIESNDSDGVAKFLEKLCNKYQSQK